jgi:predicted nuclease of restriction endonuclease-like (RecB) superfamily
VFPEIKGFSLRNLKYMRAFAQAYSEEAIVQQVVALIPWGHNVRLLENVKNYEERLWYIHKTIENGWKRNILIHQLFKDPYNLEFLDIHEEVHERKLQEALVNKLRDFLLELGAGFAFVGNLNFYLSDVDGVLHGPGDEPSIGLILCKSKNKIVAEYSLQDSPKPMGVSTYNLPKKLKISDFPLNTGDRHGQSHV